MADKRRKRSDGLETINRVITAATTELDKYGSTAFNLERVMKKANASRSSIYHHFGSRVGLIAAVETQKAIANQFNEMKLMRDFILSSKDANAILAAIEFALSADGGKDGRLRRMRRIDRIVASSKSKVLNKSLVDAQVEGSRHLTETLEMAKALGLIDPRVETSGISYWIQSLLIGRILVDIGADEAEEKAWVTTTINALGHLLRP